MGKQHSTKHELPSAFSLFKPSFDAVVLNSWTFLGLIMAPFALYILAFVTGSDQSGGGVANPFVGGKLLFAIAYFVIAMLVGPSITYLQLESAKGVEATLGEAVRGGMKYFWRFYGVALLAGLAIIGGLILLVVPGLIMMRRYYLAQFYLMDRNVGVLEAMRLSAADSKPYSGAIWGVIGVGFLLSLPSIIPVLIIVSIGLAVAYMCAPAIRYLQIKDVTKSHPAGKR